MATPKIHGMVHRLQRIKNLPCRLCGSDNTFLYNLAHEVEMTGWYWIETWECDDCEKRFKVREDDNNPPPAKRTQKRLQG